MAARRRGELARRLGALLLAVLSCCAGPAEPVERAAGPGARRAAEGPVVARAGDRLVTAPEVAEAMARHGYDAREALDRLLARELLAAEAWRRGYGARPAVRRARERAAVQILLQRDVEEAVPPPGDAEVRALFERRKDSLGEPELRFVVHLAVEPRGLDAPDGDGVSRSEPDGGAARGSLGASEEAWKRARRLAEQVLSRLQGTEEPVDALLREYRALRERHGERAVNFERLPPVVREAPLLPAFLEAIFELPEPGVVPRLVRTDFGWHVLVVERIEPGREPAFEQVAGELREELLAARRRERLDELLRELRARHEVLLDEEAAAERLEALPDSLFEAGEGR